MQCVAFKAGSAFFCILSARGCKQAVEAFIAVRQGDGGMDPGKIAAVLPFVAEIAVMQGVISLFKEHACGRICGMVVQKGEKRLNLSFFLFVHSKACLCCSIRFKNIRLS